MTNNGFGPLRLHTGEPGDEAAGGNNLRGIHLHIHAQIGAAGTNRHDNIFGGGVAGALAEAVDAGIHALGPVAQPFDGVGDGQAQVVVAVGGDTNAGETRS